MTSLVTDPRDQIWTPKVNRQAMLGTPPKSRNRDASPTRKPTRKGGAGLGKGGSRRIPATIEISASEPVETPIQSKFRSKHQRATKELKYYQKKIQMIEDIGMLHNRRPEFYTDEICSTMWTLWKVGGKKKNKIVCGDPDCGEFIPFPFAVVTKGGNMFCSVGCSIHAE